MSGIIPFAYDGSEVRVVDRDGIPWFILSDVCRILEIGNPSDAARRLDDDEKGVATVDTLGGPQDMVVINESGLYSLILKSRKPAAKAFKKWVTAEVLPTIRKTGYYNAAPLQIDVRDPGQLTKIAMQLIEVNRDLQSQIDAAKPKTDFYDQYASADGLYGLQNAARVLGHAPNKFIRRLKEGYLFYQGGSLVPKVQYREMGVFEVKCTYVDDKARYQTYVTPKGLQYLAKRMTPEVA